MPRVDMKIPAAMLGDMFRLGDRRIIGVRTETIPGHPGEQLVVFKVDAPDAPAYAAEMLPVYRTETDADGNVTRLELADMNWLAPVNDHPRH
jgi:hypothetical protein